MVIHNHTTENSIQARPEISPSRAWVMAIRPKTLPASAAPVIVGTALAQAGGVLDPLPAAAALLASLLIQIGTNLANDYFDYVKGADNEQRKGPTRVAQSGLISLRDLRIGMVATFALAVLIGLYLISVAGWPILVIGVASLISALAYTGGPFPIGYHGLGDLFVFLFFGLAGVCGTFYVQAQYLSANVALAAVPVGALTVAILVVNNLRDIDTDVLTGKHTLAVLLGARGTRLEYLLLLAITYATAPIMWLAGWASAWVLLPWLTLPLALRLIRTVTGTTEGPTLNEALAGTAQLDLAFGLLFAIGIIL